MSLTVFVAKSIIYICKIAIFAPRFATNGIVMKMTMRLLLSTTLLVLGVFVLQAQSVSYTYKPFSAEGCTVSYTPVFVGDTAYIVVSVQSDRLVFSDNPTMMVRFFNTDQILQLSGKKMDATSSSGAVMVGSVFVPYTEMKAMAMFRVSGQEMESFKSGVERVRLSTLPITHDRTFNNDKIGIPLYQNYQSEKQKAKDF